MHWAGTEIVCECANTACVELLPISHDAYEAIRQHPNHFAVKPGHEVSDVERTVERHPAYLVVEKLGEGDDLARQLDPRAS